MAMPDIKQDESVTNALLGGRAANTALGVDTTTVYNNALAHLRGIAAPAQTAPQVSPPQNPSSAVTPTPPARPATVGVNFSTGELFSGGHIIDINNGTQLDQANSQGLFSIDNAQLPEDFEPVDSSQIIDKLNQMKQGRSYGNTAAEIGKAFGRGVKYGLPEAAVQGAEYAANVAGAPSAADYFHQKNAQLETARPPADLLARGKLAQTAISTAESAPLTGAIAAGFLVNPAIGIGLGAVASGQQATQARNAVLDNGGTVANANTAAWQNFVEEAGGELAGGAIFRGMAHGTANIFGKLVGEGKLSVKQAITAATNPAVAKNFLKNLAAGTAEESAVEFAQNDAETRSMNAYGAKYQDPEEQGLQAAQQAALLTPFLGGMGIPAHLAAGQQRAALGNAINDKNNPVDMLAASRIIHGEIKNQVDPSAAAGWLGSQTRTANNFSRAQAIAEYEKNNPEPTPVELQTRADNISSRKQAIADYEKNNGAVAFDAPDDLLVPQTAAQAAPVVQAAPQYNDNKISLNPLHKTQPQADATQDYTSADVDNTLPASLDTTGGKAIQGATKDNVVQALHGNDVLIDGTHAQAIADAINPVLDLSGRVDKLAAATNLRETAQDKSGLEDRVKDGATVPKWSTRLRTIAAKMNAATTSADLVNLKSEHNVLRTSIKNSNRGSTTPDEAARALNDKVVELRDRIPHARDLKLSTMKAHGKILSDVADQLDTLQKGSNLTGGRFEEIGTGETLATLQDKLKKSIDNLVKSVKSRSTTQRAHAAIEQIIASYKSEKERLNAQEENSDYGDYDPNDATSESIAARNSKDRQLSMAWNAYKQGRIATINKDNNTDQGLSYIPSSIIRGSGVNNTDASKSPLNVAATDGFKYPSGVSVYKGSEAALRYVGLSGTPMTRLLSKLLTTSLKGKFPEIKFLSPEQNVGVDKINGFGNYKFGRNQGPNGTVRITKASPEVLTHELLHAATAQWVLDNPTHPLVVGLATQFEHLRNYIDTPSNKKKYRNALDGTVGKNVFDTISSINRAGSAEHQVSEFISYAMTRSYFMDFIRNNFQMTEKQLDKKGLGLTSEERRLKTTLTTIYRYFTSILKKMLGLDAVGSVNLNMASKQAFTNALVDRIVLVTQQAQNTTVSKENNISLDMEKATTPDGVQPILNAVRQKVDSGNILDAILSAPFKLLAPKYYGKEATGIQALENKASDKSDAFMRAHPTVAFWYAKVGEYVGVPKGVKEAINDIYKQSREADSNLGNRLEDTLRSISTDQENAIMEVLQNPEKISALPKEYRSVVEELNEKILRLRDKAAQGKGLDVALQNATVAEMIQYATTKKDIASAGFSAKVVSLNPTYRIKQEIETSEVIFPQGDPSSTRYFAVLSDKSLGRQVPTRFISVDDRAAVAAYGADKSISYSFDKVINASKVQFVRNSTLKEITASNTRVPIVHYLANTINVLSKVVAARELINNLNSVNNDVEGKSKFIYDSTEALLAAQGKTRIIDWGNDGSQLHPIDREAARRNDVWVKVPARYGSLKGSYINGAVFSAMLDLNGNEQFITSPTYNRLMQTWKGGKTKWSPATHMTNAVSNIGMAYMHDIPISTVKLAASIIHRQWRDKGLSAGEKNLLKLFNQSGAVLGNYSANELHRKLGEALANDTPDDNEVTDSLWSKAKFMLRYEYAKSKLIKLDTAAGDLYQFEDNMFRFAAFMKEAAVQQERHGQLGERQVIAAGAFAKYAMIDYNINAKFVNALRQTALPFLAWPYRAIPMMTRIAYQKPWKMAGMMSVVYGLNALGYAIAGGDEDDERKKLPDFMKQHVWGIGPSAYVRMPWGDSDKPTFMGVGKFIPNGDVIQQNDQGFMGVANWPAFATPTGPWVSLLMAGAGWDAFQGRKLWADSNTSTQNAMASLKYLNTQVAPNVPLINAKINQQIDDAYRGKKGLVGNDIDGMYTISRFFGARLYQMDAGELTAQQGLQVKALLKDYHSQIMSAAHAESRFGEPDYDSVLEANIQRGQVLLDKIQKLTGEY